MTIGELLKTCSTEIEYVKIEGEQSKWNKWKIETAKKYLSHLKVKEWWPDAQELAFEMMCIWFNIKLVKYDLKEYTTIYEKQKKEE